ncbi:MAG: GtrA family protein, partial [Bacilli bacterium]|nr:GtrA family protein [Bacilli bacterium]
KEIVKFYSSRLTTLFLDMLIMFIFVTKLEFNDKIIKIIVQIIIILLNYILSKILVFKQK